MRSKLFAVLVLVSVTAVFALAGCGGKPSATDKDTGQDLTKPLTLPSGGLDPSKAPAPTGTPTAPATSPDTDTGEGD